MKFVSPFQRGTMWIWTCCLHACARGFADVRADVEALRLVDVYSRRSYNV